MKKFFKITFISSALGLMSLASFPLLAQDKPAAISGAAIKGAAVAPATTEAAPELKKAAEAVAKAMDRKECEKAFEFMTDKGANEYIGSMLMQLAGLNQMAGAGDIPESVKNLQKLASEIGLDKVQMPEFMPTGAPDDMDKLIKITEEVRDKLLACLPEKDRRKKAIEIVKALGESMEMPMTMVVGSIEVNGDQADVGIDMEIDPALNAPGGSPTEYLTFVKKNGAWKFDGFNNQRTFAEMAQAMPQGAQPFKAIEDLTIEGKTMDGKPLSLADYKGKVVLVDFWATWCGPCVASLPELSALHEKYKAKGFEILGIAGDDVEQLKPFLEKKPLAWKHLVDPDTEIAVEYEVEGFPTTFLVDKQGKHVATNLHGETLAKAIELLLDGKTIESINGSAQDILAAGQKQAASEKKLVFLHFSAAWCGPCQALEKWMAQPEIHKLLSPVLVDVKIDTDLNSGAHELLESLTTEVSGIPWFAIMNATDAKPIMTSDAEKIGNIGLPDSPEGQAHFVKMFAATGKFSKEQLELIRSTIAQAVTGFSADKSK